MSNLEASPSESACGGLAAAGPAPAPRTLLPREVPLGGPKGIAVRRTIPHRDIRTIGAWCFADHYGPVDLAGPGSRGMRVPPHPHLGLQTVSWLLEGQIVHRDSLGSEQPVGPGELSLMTAGAGIAHSEYSAPGAQRLLGVQLWVALTEAHRDRPPGFEHHANLPAASGDGATITAIIGEVAGLASPATAYSPLIGAQVRLGPRAHVELPLEPDLEYGVLVADGSAQVAGAPVPLGALHYLGWGARAVRLSSAEGATLLLLGGEPLAEQLLMWWNFVGRDHDEIAAARSDWEAGRRFGEVPGDPNPRLPAPPLPTARMMPRASRRPGGC